MFDGIGSVNDYINYQQIIWHTMCYIASAVDVWPTAKSQAPMHVSFVDRCGVDERVHLARLDAKQKHGISKRTRLTRHRASLPLLHCYLSTKPFCSCVRASTTTNLQLPIFKAFAYIITIRMPPTALHVCADKTQCEPNEYAYCGGWHIRFVLANIGQSDKSSGKIKQIRLGNTAQIW